MQDIEEKKQVIEKMSEIGKEKLSPNFLFAHGFDNKAGWSILNEDQGMLIVKLVDVKTEKGLKSP